MKPERIAACPRIAFIAVLLAGALPAAAPRSLVAQDVAQMVRDLGSSDATVRATAACALGQVKDVAAVRRARARLLELLTDDTPVDGKLCRRWENQWGEQGSTPGREAAIALEDLGTEVLAPLVDILDGRSPVGRENAALALGLIENEGAIDPLLDRLADDDVARVRARAAWALGMIESSVAVDGLAAAVRRDADAETRSQAAWGLGMIESPEGVGALIAAMGDRDAKVRAQAAWGLGMIESPEGVPGLRRAVDDGDAEVRAQAAWGLGMIEAVEGVEPLLRLLRDREARVRAQAAWGLGMIEDRGATDGLIRSLRDDDPEVRAQSAWALGMIEDPAALDALLDALEDESEDVQEQAMWAVGQVIRDGGMSGLDRHDLAARLRRALGRKPPRPDRLG